MLFLNYVYEQCGKLFINIVDLMAERGFIESSKMIRGDIMASGEVEALPEPDDHWQLQN